MRGWPLLPVLGGKLVRVGSAVVEEGSWSAGVGAALAKLSCRVLDTSVIKLDVAKVRRCSSKTVRRLPGFACLLTFVCWAGSRALGVFKTRPL